jgi:hypothetical protein
VAAIRCFGVICLITLASFSAMQSEAAFLFPSTLDGEMRKGGGLSHVNSKIAHEGQRLFGFHQV